MQKRIRDGFKLGLFCLLMIISEVRAAYNPHTVVEGFYWDGQGEYTHSQRRALLSQLPPESIYIHMPQESQTLQPWPAPELSQWQTTKSYCQSKKLQLIIGIRPLIIQNIDLTVYKIEKKIRQLDVPFVLGWDDCEDGETQVQRARQRDVVGRLTRKPWGIVPAAYFADDGDIQGWVKRLGIIDDVDKSIPFILCSKNGYTPSSLDPTTDFPPLKRKMIFWDNWMAVDELTRFPRNLPRSRSPTLFSPNHPYGYMLNLCFPPERIFHGLKSIAYQEQSLPYNYHKIATEWTTYLLEQKFIGEGNRTAMQGALWELIQKYDGTMDVEEIVREFPVLGAFLYEKEEVMGVGQEREE